MSHDSDDIPREILRLLAARAPEGSICPSDVARNLRREEGAWRALMPRIRDAARHMASEGVVVITRGGETLDPRARFGGPIRLRRGPRFASPA